MQRRLRASLSAHGAPITTNARLAVLVGIILGMMCVSGLGIFGRGVAQTKAKDSEARKWFPKDLPVVHMNERQHQPPATFASGAFIPRSHAWVQDGGELLRTTDGGTTWVSLQPI